MSIFVSSTKQTDSDRISFAASASFCALLFAASPTISIRSGMSRATLSALSPIEPVAPRITTRLRFIFRQNEQNLPNGLKRYRLRFWNTKFFLKFQSLRAKIQKQTFIDAGCDEVIHELNFVRFRQ